jgi:hypothetical protein
VIFVGVVPEWEKKNHFCTEVVQKAVIRKIIRSGAVSRWKEIPSRNQIFDRQKVITAIFSMELRIRGDPWGILKLGGVEKVRKWHTGCGEAGHCGICFDKTG